MKSISFYLSILSLFFFPHYVWGSYFIKDGALFFKEGKNAYLKLDIDKPSDNDIVELKIGDANNKVDVYDYSSSNSSYSVSTIRYDHDRKKFIQERLEYVNNCSYCSDLKTEYCSVNKVVDVSKIDFYDKGNKAICYSTYEGKPKGSEFSTLRAVVDSFYSNRQYMKSFLPNDIAEILVRFPQDKDEHFAQYKRIIELLREEKEYLLLSFLVKKLSISKDKEIRIKTYLYNNPYDRDKTKLYLIKGDLVSILDEKIDEHGEKWYFINYKGKKEINMWIKADSLDLN